MPALPRSPSPHWPRAATGSARGSLSFALFYKRAKTISFLSIVSALFAQNTRGGTKSVSRFLTLAPLFFTPLALSCEGIREGCALLHQSENHLLFFQSPARSLCVYPGCHPERFSIFQPANLPTFKGLTPLGATLTKNRGEGGLLTRLPQLRSPSDRQLASARAFLTSHSSRSNLRAKLSTHTAAACLQSPQSARSARGEP